MVKNIKVQLYPWFTELLVRFYENIFSEFIHIYTHTHTQPIENFFKLLFWVFYIILSALTRKLKKKFMKRMLSLWRCKILNLWWQIIMILPAQRIVGAHTGWSLKIQSAALSHRVESKMFETVNLADPYIAIVCRKKYIWNIIWLSHYCTYIVNVIDECIDISESSNAHAINDHRSTASLLFRLVTIKFRCRASF